MCEEFALPTKDALRALFANEVLSAYISFQAGGSPGALPHSFAMRGNLLLRVSLCECQHFVPFRQVIESFLKVGWIAFPSVSASVRVRLATDPALKVMDSC